MARALLGGLKRPVEVRGCGSSVDKEVGPGNEGSLRTHEQFGHIGHFVGRARTPGRTRGGIVWVKGNIRTDGTEFF